MRGWSHMQSRAVGLGWFCFRLKLRVNRNSCAHFALLGELLHSAIYATALSYREAADNQTWRLKALIVVGSYRVLIADPLHPAGSTSSSQPEIMISDVHKSKFAWQM